ncbi:MAG: DMT family transporter [Pseudomonadota bacterium]
MRSAIPERQYLKDVASVLLATLLWSLSGVFVRLISTHDGWQINAYRGISTSAALLIFLFAVYGRDTSNRFRAIEWRAFVLSAGFFALGSTLYVVALSLTSVANVSCIAATAPIFSAVLARIFANERTGLLAWAATAMAIGGVYFILRDSLGGVGQAGDLVAIAVAFCFASQTVVLRKYRSVDMVPAICVGGVAVFALVALFIGLSELPARDLALIAAMGVIQLAAPLVLFIRGARTVPAIQLSLIALLDVVFNPLWAYIGVGEVPDRNAFIGGAIIVSAVGITVLGRAWARTTAQNSDGK